MKNKLIILGIAVLFICVGLSGCNELSGTVSLRDIKDHPNKYLEQAITVDGYYSAGFIASSNSPKSESEAMEVVTTMLMIENNQDSVTLYEGGKYRFTGVLKEKTVLFQTTIYLEVSKVESL